jgi:hypothetical protein
VGVYVDDYVLGVVVNNDRSLILRVSRATLHAIYSIFPPPEISGHVGGKYPISRKKLEKGDVAALCSMIWLQGYDLLRIGPHSLRASGAMQLKLMEYVELTP